MNPDREVPECVGPIRTGRVRDTVRADGHTVYGIPVGIDDRSRYIPKEIHRSICHRDHLTLIVRVALIHSGHTKRIGLLIRESSDRVGGVFYSIGIHNCVIHIDIVAKKIIFGPVVRDPIIRILFCGTITV